MARDHVIKLNISGSSMKGFLARELGQITYLQELYVNFFFIFVITVFFCYG
jgi:hypothetical protein